MMYRHQSGNPGGIPELAPPDIITYAVVAPEEIVVLFQMYVRLPFLTDRLFHDGLEHAVSLTGSM